MGKNKALVIFFLLFLVSFAVLTGCTGDGMGPGLTEKSGADSGKNVTLSNTGPLPSDKKDIAVEILAVRNQSRRNASGPKIPSGAYSEEFPGIYFIWDSKSDNDGYLFVDKAVFNVYTNFVLTTKESNEYWDFFIKPQDGQQTTEDGRYVFFLPRVSGKNNVNMVFLSEQAKQAKDPADPVDDPDDPIEGPIDPWIPPDGGVALLRLGPHGNFRAYHEGWAYAMCDNGLDRRSLYRMRPDGTEKQKIQDEDIGESVYHDGWLYGDTNGLYRMRLDGSEKMQLYTGHVVCYVIKDEWIYFVSDDNLYRVKVNGSGLKKLADNCYSDFLSKPVIAQGYIFFRSRDHKIIRYNLDGTCCKTVLTVLIEGERSSFKPVFTDSEYLYYTLYFGDYYVADRKVPLPGVELHRVKFDGTKRQTLVQHSSYWLLDNIFLKDGYIYYSHNVGVGPDNDYNTTSYYRLRPDGTDHVLLCDKVRNHWLSEIIGSHIYYSGGGDFLGLYRLSINGGSPEAVYTYPRYSEYYTGFFVANNTCYIVVR